ncbi:MAG: cation:proton antiporter [Spirochaeta sp.]|nr:cation:proton antiporter [Spirochaeta sp.]
MLSAFSLILTGIFGVLTRKNLVKILLSLNILETGINLLVVSLGYFKGGEAPILTTSISATQGMNFVDPLPHALVLTSIVIGLGTTALALTLILNHFRSHRAVEFVKLEVNE